MALFYVEDKALEILAFGMADVDGMVGRLRELVENADAAAGLLGGGEDAHAEHVLADELRTGEGKEDSAWGYLAECLCVETAVAAQAVLQCSSVLDESGGVEDDEIVGAVGHVVEVAEGVGGEGFVAPVTPGRILFEAEGVPLAVAQEALRLGAQKLPITTKFIVRRDYVETTI